MPFASNEGRERGRGNRPDEAMAQENPLRRNRTDTAIPQHRGHRPPRPGRSGHPAPARAVPGVLRGPAARVPGAAVALVSALASGGDQLAAEEAFALGIEVMVPLPLPQAEYERDFHDAQALAHFQEPAGEGAPAHPADGVGNTADAVRERGPARNRQYAQLGMFVSLALPDPARAVGRRAERCHRRHRAGGRLPPAQRDARFSAADAAPNLLADDESDLVYHIRCSRRLASTQGASNPAAAAPRWLTAEGRHRAGFADAGAIPPRVRADAGFQPRRPAPCRGDRSRAASLLAHDLPAAVGRGARGGRAVRRGRLAGRAFPPPRAHQHAADARVRGRDGPRLILYSDLDTNRTYIAVFLLLFGMSVLIRWIGKRREWHRKYLDYRGLAEGLRVQMYWRLAGVEPPPNDKRLRQLPAEADVDLSWIRHAMRSTGLPNDEGVPARRPLAAVGDRCLGRAARFRKRATGLLRPGDPPPRTGLRGHHPARRTGAGRRRRRRHRAAAVRGEDGLGGANPVAAGDGPVAAAGRHPRGVLVPRTPTRS